MCPDARMNCETNFGTDECESTSGCQGGVGNPCAANLTGPFCQLCDRERFDVAVYYKPSTGDEVAACVDCNSMLSESLLPALWIVPVAVLLLLLSSSSTISFASFAPGESHRRLVHGESEALHGGL